MSHGTLPEEFDSQAVFDPDVRPEAYRSQTEVDGTIVSRFGRYRRTNPLKFSLVPIFTGATA